MQPICVRAKESTMTRKKQSFYLILITQTDIASGMQTLILILLQIHSDKGSVCLTVCLHLPLTSELRIINNPIPTGWRFTRSCKHVFNMKWFRTNGHRWLSLFRSNSLSCAHTVCLLPWVLPVPAWRDPCWLHILSKAVVGVSSVRYGSQFVCFYSSVIHDIMCHKVCWCFFS